MNSAVNTLEHYWMPFTSNRDFKANPRIVVKGEGLYYTTHEGHQVLDGSSGLFCCALGHGRAEIARAVYQQLLDLDYSAPFQGAHPGQFELASRVVRLTPEGINRVFFLNSGSEAVDTALKIALAYHRARGEGGRMRFVSRERAYHGVNIGGTSLSGMVKNRDAFGVGMAGVAHLRHTWLEENRYTSGQPTKGGGTGRGFGAYHYHVRGRDYRGLLCGTYRGLHWCLGASDRLSGASKSDLRYLWGAISLR